MGDGVRIQAIERAIMIMNCFTDEEPELRLQEICDRLDLNKSTAHGILNTLKHHGLMEQDPETQKYRLGLNLLVLGGKVLNRLDIRTVASPIIKDVCGKTDETVHLGILDGTEVVYIDKQESSQSMRLFTAIGTRYPAYCTGIGKAILAFLPIEDQAKRIPDQLNRFTANTLKDKREVMEHLKLVKQTGYAIDDEENMEGLRCVGAPIFNHTGKVVAAVSVAGPSIRMTKERLPMIADLLCESAEEISRRLGYKK
ncbi:MAG: IclR family transcriptional regulator [Clostridiales bacterium]|nr:IclR family transcriptional regulator [Clostridiales bacterium]